MRFFLISIMALVSIGLLSFGNPGYDVQDTVKDFSLKNVTGKMVSLQNYQRAKGAIVIFTCNHCPFSKAYENRIIALHDTFAKQGWPVIAINSNDSSAYPEDSYENMQKRAREKKYPFVYLYDNTQEVAKAFGAQKTPHVFLLSKKGTDFMVRYTGAIDDNTDEPEKVKVHYVEQAIHEMIAGKEISVRSTKAIGCGIKWKK